MLNIWIIPWSGYGRGSELSLFFSHDLFDGGEVPDVYKLYQNRFPGTTPVHAKSFGERQNLSYRARTKVETRREFRAPYGMYEEQRASGLHLPQASTDQLVVLPHLHTIANARFYPAVLPACILPASCLHPACMPACRPIFLRPAFDSRISVGTLAPSACSGSSIFCHADACASYRTTDTHTSPPAYFFEPDFQLPKQLAEALPNPAASDFRRYGTGETARWERVMAERRKSEKGKKAR